MCANLGNARVTTDKNTLPDKPGSIKFGTPIALLLVMLALITGGLLQLAVNGQDRVAREASQTVAAAAFNAEREALDSLARDYSWWNAAIENLIFELNMDWVKENLDWLPENFGVSRVFVFGPGREPVYASLDTEPVDLDSAEWRNQTFLELVTLAESQPNEPGAFAAAYVNFSDGVHLVAASKLLEEGEPADHPPYPDKGVLVVTKKIDEMLLEAIEENFQLPGLELQLDPWEQEPGAALALALAGPDGDAVAGVTWAPPQPGTRLLEGLVLPLGIAFVLVGGVIGLIVTRARRAGQELQQAFDARVAAQQELEYSARHDSLTHLPNRALFMEHLMSAITHSDRYGSSFTFHYLDLDGFKEVNDTFGHLPGDELLRELAVRLRNIVRTADTIARFGGDEFAVLQRSSGERESAGLLAERMIRAVEQPFEIAGHSLHVTLSVGIAFETGGEDPEEIIRNADRALYRAKWNGGNRFELYDAALDDRGLQQASRPGRRPGFVTNGE